VDCQESKGFLASLQDEALSLEPTRPRLEELDIHDPANKLVLTLKKTLCGLSTWRKAQVWTALTPNKSTTVVVKIFQDCFLDEPFWARPSSKADYQTILCFTPEQEQAHREAWAYQCLHVLQGRCIPHSYGFFKVCHINSFSSNTDVF